MNLDEELKNNWPIMNSNPSQTLFFSIIKTDKGWLSIWNFAPDADQAAAKLGQIMLHLPYTLTEQDIICGTSPDWEFRDYKPSQAHIAGFEYGRSEVQRCGLGIWGDFAPIGIGLNQTLFHSIIKAEPTRGHPRYFDHEYGWLSIWNFAPDADQAAARVGQIMLQLPYRRIQQDPICGTRPDGTICPPEHNAGFEQARSAAQHYGLGIWWDFAPIGTDLVDGRIRSDPI